MLIPDKAALTSGFARDVANLSHARDQYASVRAAPIKLRVLNLAISCAVQSGFRYLAFAFYAWPSLPTS